MTVVLDAVAYERKYRDDILSLMFYSRYTHTHLDWYKAGHWLELEGNTILLAIHQDAIIGMIGVSEPLNDAAWMRMAIVARGYDPAMVLGFLWEQLRLDLARKGASKAAVLLINPWLAQYLPAIGFNYLEDVITLHRSLQDLPIMPENGVTLRNGYLEDLDEIVVLDHVAFAPPWQMSASDIRLSQRQTASCTLAIVDDEVIGYEMATKHHTAGHLARLAVHPDSQGQRVGQILLNNLLARFTKRGVKGMTVNTQESNIRSQRLYERYGFIRNGFDLPVWEMEL